MISKSCKVVPVMLVGKFVHGKSYPWVEYIEVRLMDTIVMFWLLSPGNDAHVSEQQGRLGASLWHPSVGHSFTRLGENSVMDD